MSGKNFERDSGIALVTALLLLATMSAVTAAAVALGLYLSQATAVSGHDAQSRYLAESALNRTIFYLKKDVAEHTSRTLGTVDYNKRSAVFVQPRFMADGIAHTVDVGEKSVTATITDASGGFCLTPFDSLATRLAERRGVQQTGKRISLEEEWAFARFTNQLGDFFDVDDGRTLDGLERAEYLKAGRANLPRNGEIEYREELLWIPDAAKYLGSMAEIQLLAPAGLTAIPETVNLYSSPVDLITQKINLTTQESQRVATALEKWRTEATFIEVSLPNAIYKKLMDEDSGIEVQESGFYHVKIALPDSPKVLNVTFTLTSGTNFLEFYEYTLL